MTKQLIRITTVEDKTGYKKSWIYREIKAQTFPAPIKIGRTTVWDEALVDEWIDARIRDHQRHIT